MHTYTSAELKFLKNKGSGRTRAELTDLFNKRFGLSVTASQVSGVCFYHKMHFGRIYSYTPAEKRFLERKVAGRSYAELTALFNRRFGHSFTVERIASTLKRLKLSNGRNCRFQPDQIPFNKGRKGIRLSPETEFKPGHMPHNWQPVGTEITDANGYMKVKTRNPKTWKFKQRLIWEKAYGKIPRRHVVIFADGNKLNFALKNLLLISRSELAVMNHLGLITPHAGLTMTGKAIADLKLAIAKLRKTKRKKRKGRRN